MFEPIGLTALLWLLLLFCGWWITRLVLPAAWRPLEYVLAPLAGLFWIDSLLHALCWLGLPGRAAFSFLLVLTAGLNALALLRRGRPRWPNRTEAAVLLCALPALTLALFPLLATGHVLPIGDTNGDPVSHALMTGYLLEHSMRGAVPPAEGFAVWQPVYGKLDLGIRLGFHFVQLALDLLSGRPAFATFSILSAFGLFLTAQALYLLVRHGLGPRPLSPAAARCWPRSMATCCGSITAVSARRRWGQGCCWRRSPPGGRGCGRARRRRWSGRRWQRRG